MHDIEHLFYKGQRDKSRGAPLLAVRRGDEVLFFHTLCTKRKERLFSVPLLPLVRKIEAGDSGGWIRFPAEKPRRLRRATGAPPRAGFRIHPRKRKTVTPDGVTGKKTSGHLLSERQKRETVGVDSLFCGKATPVAARHWRTAKSRLSNPPSQKKNGNP